MVRLDAENSSPIQWPPTSPESRQFDHPVYVTLNEQQPWVYTFVWIQHIAQRAFIELAEGENWKKSTA
jgi:hypothetical protein